VAHKVFFYVPKTKSMPGVWEYLLRLQLKKYIQIQFLVTYVQVN